MDDTTLPEPTAPSKVLFDMGARALEIKDDEKNGPVGTALAGAALATDVVNAIAPSPEGMKLAMVLKATTAVFGIISRCSKMLDALNDNSPEKKKVIQIFNEINDKFGILKTILTGIEKDPEKFEAGGDEFKKSLSLALDKCNSTVNNTEKILNLVHNNLTENRGFWSKAADLLFSRLKSIRKSLDKSYAVIDDSIRSLEFSLSAANAEKLGEIKAHFLEHRRDNNAWQDHSQVAWELAMSTEKENAEYKEKFATLAGKLLETQRALKLTEKLANKNLESANSALEAKAFALESKTFAQKYSTQLEKDNMRLETLNDSTNAALVNTRQWLEQVNEEKESIQQSSKTKIAGWREEVAQVKAEKNRVEKEAREANENAKTEIASWREEVAQVKAEKDRVEKEKREAKEKLSTDFFQYLSTKVPLMTLEDQLQFDMALALDEYDIAADIIAKYIPLEPEEKSEMPNLCHIPWVCYSVRSLSYSCEWYYKNVVSLGFVIPNALYDIAQESFGQERDEE